MSDLGWWILVGVAALVMVVVLVRVTRRRNSIPSESFESAESVALEEEVGPVPLEHQPIVPSEQAQGYGWMKASDLAGGEK